MAQSTNRIADGLIGAIGNTPLIRLRRASEATGCEILGKAEFMNPGGSVKDRAGLAIIEDAERRGVLQPGGVIVEGTAGNTGIGITLVASARGYRSVIVMPETQSQEKIDFLRMIGADLRLVPAKPYKDPGNYVRYSERLAAEIGGVWANQFDNLANREGHRLTTGREIWAQTDGQVDAFTCSCGTGGDAGGGFPGAEGAALRREDRARGSGGERAVRVGDERRHGGEREFDHRGDRAGPGDGEFGGGGDR